MCCIVAMADGIQYRKVEPRDLSELKRLHELFFPVKYTDSFYDDMVQGIGINGKPLFVIVVEAINPIQNQQHDSNSSLMSLQPEMTMIGFILAQIMNIQDIEDDLFGSIFNESPDQVCYILTIGVVEEYRRHNIGKTLLRMAYEHSVQHTSCGAVSIISFEVIIYI